MQDPLKQSNLYSNLKSIKTYINYGKIQLNKNKDTSQSITTVMVLITDCKTFFLSVLTQTYKTLNNLFKVDSLIIQLL